jgi:long-chain fatty acid transport protein
MRPLLRCIPLSILLLGGLAPATVRASPLLEAPGSVGDNAGAQGVVSGPGAASTYFNPALLVFAEDDLLLGFAIISEQVGVTLEGRTGGEVPLVVGGRDVFAPNGTPLPNSVVPTQWLQQGCPPGTGAGECPAPGFAARPRQSMGTSGKTRPYLALGLVKHLLSRRLSLGFYALLPLGGYTTAQAFYPDEREALFSDSLHPELYGDRLTAVSLVAGAALELLPNLSVGASVSIGLANAATSSVYVQDATNYNTLLLNNGVTTSVDVSPTLGVAYTPVGWLRLGGVVHAPESFKLTTDIDNTLPSGTESSTTQQNVFDWMPWRFGMGAEAELLRTAKQTLSLVGSLEYGVWSSYEDRHGQSPSIYGPGLGWSNTLSGALGVRGTYDAARLFLDFRYIPSPVPQQVGRSNYVDNDRFGILLGGDVVLPLPWKIRPGLQLFADRLVPRSNEKNDALVLDEVPDGSYLGSTHQPIPGAQGLQTNNPGWPGFSSGGWLWGGALTLSVPL